MWHKKNEQPKKVFKNLCIIRKIKLIQWNRNLWLAQKCSLIFTHKISINNDYPNVIYNGYEKMLTKTCIMAKVWAKITLNTDYEYI